MPEWSSVRAVATSNVALTGLQVIDGVSLIAGDRVLLAGQTAGAENGIRVAAAGAWDRATDANLAAHFDPGKTVYIREGTAHGTEEWRFVNTVTPTLDTTILNFEGPEEAEVLESYIEGLGLSYVDATTVGLGAGRAYVPGLGKVLTVGSDQTATRLPGASALSYGYLEEYPAGSGLGRLRLITTAPGAPYLGTARTQGDDTTARYLGMLRNDGAGNLIVFRSTVMGGETVLIMYVGATSGGPDTFIALDNGAATTATPVDLGPTGAKLVSPASDLAYLKASGTNLALSPDAAFTTTANIFLNDDYPIPLASGQIIYYSLSAGTVDISVMGYYERR